MNIAKYNFFFQYFSDILGGLSPEELSKEPSNIIDPMFDTLLELATNDQQNSDEEIRALASACLLSLSVAYGDTGRLLTHNIYMSCSCITPSKWNLYRKITFLA